MSGSRKMRAIGPLVLLTTMGLTVATDCYMAAAQAQTQGMMRRQDRRGTRQEARAEKRDCNASGESTRAGCRQEKRDIRQDSRSARLGTPYGTPP